MANYDDINAIRGLSQTEINKLNNAQLKLALGTMVVAERERAKEPSNSEILNEIRELNAKIHN